MSPRSVRLRGASPGYPGEVKHAGPGGPQTPRGRAAVVVLGIPLGLAGLAFALTAWASTDSDPAAAIPPQTTTQVSAEVAGESLAPDSAVDTPAFEPATPVEATDPVESTDDAASAESATEESNGSESGRSGPSDINLANPGLEVVWSIETEDPVFFITVDDNVRDEGVAQAGLEVIRANQIPITAFLTTNYVGEDTEYFDAVTAFGGSVQNHTVTHPFFNDPSVDPYFEVCTAQDRLAAQFGDTPWMLRPPYGEPYFSGASPANLEAASASCGVNRIVMWSAVVDNGNVSYNPGPTLRPGDIVLFHFWDPKFAEGLQMILDIGKANGLSPAPLEDYL